MHNDLLDGDDRLREVAAILAGGILRLRAHEALPGAEPADQRNLLESAQNQLDVSAETLLMEHGG